VLEAFVYDYIDPVLQLCLTFPVDMDTTILPPKSKFKIRTDVTDRAVTELAWLNDRVLSAGLSTPGLSFAFLRFIYTTQTGKLKTALGAEVDPFELLGTKNDVSYAPVYSEPIFTGNIIFELDMDPAVKPLVTDLVLKIDGVEKNIANITWFGTTLLSIVHFEGGLTPVNSTITFTTPTNLLRTAGGQQACPFELTEPVT